MRRILGMVGIALTVALAGAACSKGSGPEKPAGLPSGLPTDLPSGLASLLPTAVPTLTLHNDKFPCNLATQPEIAALVGSSVAYDSIEPDGQTCVYILAGPGPTHVDIAVLDGADHTQWNGFNKSFPAWKANADMGGKSIAGLGDEAFLTETPGYAGQLDIWRGSKLVRITVDIARRLSDSDVDKLTTLAGTVIGRLP